MATSCCDYGTAATIDDIMSRLSAIFDDANDDGDIDAGEDVYASYKYLGAGRIVVEDYEEAEVRLDYATNDFARLDRFGRVLDQVWRVARVLRTWAAEPQEVMPLGVLPPGEAPVVAAGRPVGQNGRMKNRRQIIDDRD